MAYDQSRYSKEPSAQELAVAKALQDRGITIDATKRFSYVTDAGQTNYIKPDICVPHIKLAIEVDGEGHDPHKDILRDRTIRAAGWEVQHVSNSVINSHTAFHKWVDCMDAHIKGELQAKFKSGCEVYASENQYSCGICHTPINHKGNCLPCNYKLKHGHEMPARNPEPVSEPKPAQGALKKLIGTLTDTIKAMKYLPCPKCSKHDNDLVSKRVLHKWTRDEYVKEYLPGSDRPRTVKKRVWYARFHVTRKCRSCGHIWSFEKEAAM